MKTKEHSFEWLLHRAWPELVLGQWETRRKTAQDMNRIHGRTMQMAENHMKRCPNSSEVREMKTKVAMRYYHLPIRPASTNVEIKINAVGRGIRCAHQVVMKMITAVLAKQSGNIYQNKKYYILQLSTLSLGNLLLGNKSHSPQGCLWR